MDRPRILYIGCRYRDHYWSCQYRCKSSRNSRSRDVWERMDSPWHFHRCALLQPRHGAALRAPPDGSRPGGDGRFDDNRSGVVMEAGERAELPLVSIMVVSFNERAFIEDCVISAVSQEYPHIEIVVSDDASTDGTREIVAQMAKEHSNVTALFSDVRGGVTNNCNRALSACNGSYVALMAGDDLLCPGKIETQVAWLEADQRRVLCYHDTYLLNERSNRMGLCSADLPMREGVGPSKIIRHGPPGAACSVMLRRSALPDTGFDERIAMVSDWKLMVDSLRGRGVFGFVPGILGCYRC